MRKIANMYPTQVVLAKIIFFWNLPLAKALCSGMNYAINRAKMWTCLWLLFDTGVICGAMFDSEHLNGSNHVQLKLYVQLSAVSKPARLNLRIYSALRYMLT